MQWRTTRNTRHVAITISHMPSGCCRSKVRYDPARSARQSLAAWSIALLPKIQLISFDVNTSGPCAAHQPFMWGRVSFHRLFLIVLGSIVPSDSSFKEGCCYSRRGYVKVSVPRLSSVVDCPEYYMQRWADSGLHGEALSQKSRLYYMRCFCSLILPRLIPGNPQEQMHADIAVKLRGAESFSQR